MKRIVSLLFVCLLFISCVALCFAEEFVNPPILDGAQYLDKAQLEELSEKIDGIRQKYQFDVAIVTEDEMEGYDAMSSADDIYDYQGYGAGGNDDGILLYICRGTREYHITTHADGMRVFNERGIEYLKKNIEKELKKDNYYLAMDTFADLADELLEMAANGEPYNKEDVNGESSDKEQMSLTYILVVLGGALLIPLIIAKMMTGSKLAKMKTAVENDYATNYVKSGSKCIDFSRDIYLYSNITKTERPKNDSVGHRSSSGRTHGGGGGSF